jgi:hypothetical protein
MNTIQESEKSMISLQKYLDPTGKKYRVGRKFGTPKVNYEIKPTWFLYVWTSENKTNIPSEWEGFIVEHRENQVYYTIVD